jgi:hypothetical protein
VNRHDAAMDSQSGLKLFERGIGSLLDELVQTTHLRTVQRGGIVSARQRRGATAMSIAVQPSLKRRKVNAIECCHMRLGTAPRLVGRDGAFPDLSSCYTHAPIINISLLHVNIKLL